MWSREVSRATSRGIAGWNMFPSIYSSVVSVDYEYGWGMGRIYALATKYVLNHPHVDLISGI